jgi:hypothetical protein
MGTFALLAPSFRDPTLRGASFVATAQFARLLLPLIKLEAGVGGLQCHDVYVVQPEQAT